MKKPYLILLLAIISILFSSTFVYASPTISYIIDTNALDDVMVSQMAKHGLPGVALAVIENGEVIYQKG